jgi:hypothetical protein
MSTDLLCLNQEPGVQLGLQHIAVMLAPAVTGITHIQQMYVLALCSCSLGAASKVVHTELCISCLSPNSHGGNSVSHRNFESYLAQRSTVSCSNPAHSYVTDHADNDNVAQLWCAAL